MRFRIPPALHAALAASLALPAAVAVQGRARARGARPTGVHAPPAVAERFAELWCRASDVRARLATRQRVHVLTEVHPVPASPGAMRLAAVRELDLIARWRAAFEVEAVGDHDAARRAREVTERRIAAGQVHVWEDGEPRAMAG